MPKAGWNKPIEIMWIIRIDLTRGTQFVYSKAEQGFTMCIRMKKRILVGLIIFTGIMRQSPPIPKFRTIGPRFDRVSRMEFTDFSRYRHMRHLLLSKSQREGGFLHFGAQRSLLLQAQLRLLPGVSHGRKPRGSGAPAGRPRPCERATSWRDRRPWHRP